jgi:hypothetical protein
VGISGIASGYYPHLQTLEQSWNSGSAQLACDTLAAYHPTLTEFLYATPEQPLTPSRVEDFARSLSQRAYVQGCEFVLCYYVGHMFVNAGQKLALVSGGADDPAIVKALASDQWTRGERGDAFLPLAQLYDAVGSRGVPFLLFIDGCMESKIIHTRLADGGFLYDPMRPGMIIYQGPKEVLVPDDARVITGIQAEFGRAEPFLRGTNPVSFAAKPGTFAVARENPFLVGGPPIAPLAEELHRWTELFKVREGALPPLKMLLDRVVGFRGIGEIGMEGGISWSDFTKLDAITARLNVEGYVSRADASQALVQRLSFDLGVVEDFTRDPASATWTLQVKTVESTGRNRWDIWQVPAGPQAQPKRILADIVFPKIAAGAGAVYLYSDQNYQFFRWPFGAKAREKLKGQFSFAELAAGFEGKSILALRADNTLDQGGDTLLRFSGVTSEVVVKAELTQAKCIVETSAAKFAWLNGETAGVIQFIDDGIKLRDAHVCDEELSGLALSPQGLIAINTPRTRLYRLNANGAIDAAWLLDTEDRPIVAYHLGNGGMHSFGTETWFASDQSLFRIDLNRLDWHPINMPK